jgi:hypothetical protein
MAIANVADRWRLHALSSGPPGPPGKLLFSAEDGVITMRAERTWNDRSLPAALLLAAALLAQGCVSMTPWRSCEAPCTGQQFEQAYGIEICTRDGIPYVFERARWSRDEQGAFVAGRAWSRLGQPLGDVKIYAGDIDRVWTRSLSGGRVAANAALVPVALLVNQGFSSDDPALDEETDLPQSCPVPQPRSAPTSEPAPVAVPAQPEPPPAGS